MSALDLLDITLRVLMPIASFGFLGWAIYVFRHGARRGELQALTDRIESLEQTEGQVRERLVGIELTLKSMPSGDSVHRLELSVERLGGDVRVMAETVGMSARATRRMENYLMKGQEE